MTPPLAPPTPPAPQVPPAITDLVGGQIPVMFVDISASLGYIRAGRLRALGVTTRERTPLIDVPTVIEQGIPDFDVNAWFGLFAPARTSREIVTRLHAESASVLRSAAIRERLQSVGLNPAPNTPEEFAKFQKSEIQKWGKVIKQANVTVN